MNITAYLQDAKGPVIELKFKEDRTIKNQQNTEYNMNNILHRIPTTIEANETIEHETLDMEKFFIDTIIKEENVGQTQSELIKRRGKLDEDKTSTKKKDYSHVAHFRGRPLMGKQLTKMNVHLMKKSESKTWETQERVDDIMDWGLAQAPKQMEQIQMWMKTANVIHR